MGNGNAVLSHNLYFSNYENYAMESNKEFTEKKNAEKRLIMTPELIRKIVLERVFTF